MKIINTTTGRLLADHATVADSFWRRLKGLLGTKTLPQGGGLIIRPCSSIHTIGMAYSLDVLFVASDHQVVKVVTDLNPWRASAGAGCSYVIELPAGTAKRTGTGVGDRLCFYR